MVLLRVWRLSFWARVFLLATRGDLDGIFGNNAGSGGITYDASADGEAGTADSAKIDFAFSAAVTGLTAAEISVTNGTGTVTKGALAGSGKNWSLEIGVATAGDVKVKITKTGIESTEKDVAVHKAGDPVTVTYTATADGESGTAASTKIDFAFSAAVAGLTAGNITVTSGTGTVTKGALTGSGTGWSLAVTVGTAGNVKVAINKAGVESAEKNVAVHKAAEPSIVTYTASANGTSGTTSSTKIDFAFSAAVAGLAANDITVTSGTWTVTKGGLTGSGTGWSLAVTVGTAGNVKVAINKAGVESAEKMVAVHMAAEPSIVTYTASASGTLDTSNSTAITFTFNTAVTELSASDIAVSDNTGSVTKGGLTGSGASRSLGVTVNTAGIVKVKINKAGIDSEVKDVTVHKAAEPEANPVTYTAQANGENGKTASTKIQFAFSEAVTDLKAANITVSNDTGSVVKGQLSGNGTDWSLGITVEMAGNVQVEINRADIESEKKDVTVCKEENPVEEEPADNFTYTKEGETSITIKKYNGSKADVVIPGMIENLPVTKLYTQSFINLKSKLTSVVIPNTVTVIEGTVFQNNELTGSITLPSGLTTIGDYAFDNNKINTVIIPDSVTILASYAFRNNELKAVVIGDGVTSINSYTFQNNEITSLTFGSKVVTIGTSAFNTNQLTEITIPDTVTSIGTNAFASNKLTSVTIGTGVAEIKAGAFRHNSDLASITFLGSVSTLGNNVFKDTSALSSVTFNGTITTFTQNGGSSTFPGDLGDVYTNADRATGTYVSENNGTTWTKQD
jgi:hypothetical protein